MSDAYGIETPIVEAICESGDVVVADAQTQALGDASNSMLGMQLENIGEVIAVRTLHLAIDPSQKVVVKLGKPLPDALGDDHYCPYQISVARVERTFYGAGVDAFQALEIGPKMIGVDLAVLNRKVDGQLRWERHEQGGLGFPFPEDE